MVLWQRSWQCFKMFLKKEEPDPPMTKLGVWRSLATPTPYHACGCRLLQRVTPYHACEWTISIQRRWPCQFSEATQKGSMWEWLSYRLHERNQRKAMNEISWHRTISANMMPENARCWWSPCRNLGAHYQRKEKGGDLGWRQGISIGQHSSDTYVLWRSISGFSEGAAWKTSHLLHLSW